MSDNNSGIKASKRRQMEARRRRLRRRKRKRAMLLGGMLCTVCLILFSTIYGISHLLHKHTDTKEAVKTSQKQTAKSKDTSSSKEKIDTSAVKTQELVINTDNDSGKKKKKSSSKEPATITISSMGDCTLGTDEGFDQSTSFNAYYNEYGADYFFKNVRSILEADDLSVVNFEGTLTEETSRADKTFAFKAPAEYAQILTSGSVEAVNTANNHSHDYGEQSYTDTLTALDNAGITHFGYDDTAVMDIKGIKVGLVGIYELKDHLGREQQLKDNIAKVKADGAELIVVIFHWGNETETVPDTNQMTLGRLAIDEGADLVCGHHPHVLQGIETYKGKNIVYSLGNFCFGGNSSPSDMDTMIFQQTFTVTSEGVQADNVTNIIPCSISSADGYNNYQPTPASGDEASRIKSKIEECSAAIPAADSSSATSEGSDSEK